MERVEREELGNPTNKSEQPSARKLELSTESLVEKKNLNLKSTSESKELHKMQS